MLRRQAKLPERFRLDLTDGLAAVFLEQRAAHARELLQALVHVNRDANRAALVGDRARDRLAHPPRSVGRELVAALVVELVDCAHETDVALLDQVEQLEAAV